MKKRRSSVGIVLLALCILLCSFAGCGLKKQQVQPFSKANWTSTKEDVINIVGRNPDSEYDTDDYHVLQYDNSQYEGYNGIIRYCFENGTLAEVKFVIEKYDKDIFNHFINLYTTEYGEPFLENEAGKVWKPGDSNVGVIGMPYLGGSIVVNYTEPAGDAEE